MQPAKGDETIFESNKGIIMKINRGLILIRIRSEKDMKVLIGIAFEKGMNNLMNHRRFACKKGMTYLFVMHFSISFQIRFLILRSKNG